MVHKLIGFYGDRPEYIPKATDQLAIEIGSHQMVCMVQNTANSEIDAIEIFQLEQNNADWSDIFFEIKQNSRLIGPSYSNVVVFHNSEEALILPLEKMSATAAENYLSLIYGSDERSDTKFDSIQTSLPTVTIYRIRKSLTEILNRNFLLYKTQHSYTRILNDLLNRDIDSHVFLKLIVYHKHFIIALVVEGKLQLIQSYPFNVPDDILYYAISITQQSGAPSLQAHIEISGMIDFHQGLLEQLKKSFGIISFDILPDEDNIHAKPSNYASYFFTPFYKLMV